MFDPSEEYTQSTVSQLFYDEAIQRVWDNYSNCSEQNPPPPYAMPQSSFFQTGTTDDSHFTEAVSTEAALVSCVKKSIS